MAVRVAFTSCSDPMDEPVQTVWDHIAEKQPEHLVLLGDQIYMDFGLLAFMSKNPPLGRPAQMTNSEFAAAMHERYQRQWEIMRSSRLAELPELKIHGIWDDHDFAWNNSCGDSGSNDTHGPANKKDPVSRDKQKIARRLMRDFFSSLHAFASPYPSNPVTGDDIHLAEDLSVPMYYASPRSTADSGCVRLGLSAKLLLTDGRSFRTPTKSNDSTVFGEKQWIWLKQEINGGELILLACSTTLDEGGIPLDAYGDYDKLIDWAQSHSARLLCLTGDVHKIDWRHHGSRVYEAVASGAARSNFGKYGAFGIAEIADTNVTVHLHLDSPTPKITRSIDRSNWSET